MSSLERCHVLFLTESFHPVLGGGETHIRDLGRRLVASGWPATVVTRRSNPTSPQEEVVDGIRVLRVPPSGPGRIGKYLMVPAAVRAVLREAHQFDVIVVRGTRVLGLPGLLAARAVRKPVVLQAEVNGELSGEIYTWGTALDRPWARAPLELLTRARNLMMRDAEGFVAMSREISREFEAAGVAPERVAFIPHGVDTERFSPASPGEREPLRHELGLPSGATILTYTGRLLRGKGLEFLLRAFAGLAVRGPVHLLVVGSGLGQALSVEPELHATVEALGLRSRVTFTGRVDDVAPYLRASDVFVFPSLFEALGLSLVEAAACGLPLVGSRTGGIVDVIAHGRSGLLVEPGDVGSLGSALLTLVEDPALRTRLGREARRTACERFDVEDGLVRYRALFAEVACGRRRRGTSGLGHLHP